MRDDPQLPCLPRRGLAASGGAAVSRATMATMTQAKSCTAGVHVLIAPRKPHTPKSRNYLTPTNSEWSVPGTPY